MSNEEILTEVKALNSDIEKCLGGLVKAKINRDYLDVEKAHWEMENIMVQANRVCSVIIEHLTNKRITYDWT